MGESSKKVSFKNREKATGKIGGLQEKYGAVMQRVQWAEDWDRKRCKAEEERGKEGRPGERMGGETRTRNQEWQPDRKKGRKTQLKQGKEGKGEGWTRGELTPPRTDEEKGELKIDEG